MDKEKRQREQSKIRSKRYRSLKKLRRDDQEQLLLRTNEGEETEEVMCFSDKSNSSADLDGSHDGIEIEDFFQNDNNNDIHDDSSDSSVSDFNSLADDGDVEHNIPQEIFPPEIQKLRELGTKMPQTVLDQLLAILRERLLPTLPKSSKTFLRTVDARNNIIEMDDAKGVVGQFVYFGIKKALVDSVNPELHLEKIIKLQVGCDGVPVKNSANDQFWVIAGKIHFHPDVYEVFPIAIYFGKSKPKDIDEYLEDFVTEVNELQANGLELAGGIKFDFEVKCFICDTPARAFMKCILGHTGIEACERCEVVGKTLEGRRVYPDTEVRERTDASFRSQRQARHHHRPSPLLQISPFLNLVAFFILDFMHLFCQGIMKKLLEYWIEGDLNFRLDVRGRAELGRRMECLSSQIPFEFQRKTRTTAAFAKWKATEFRFFLLYCGPVVLRKLLKNNFYEHFLLLHVAARILCCESLCRVYNSHAKYYLKYFFTTLKDLYGPASQILNAHHLIHVADDVISMDCNLSRITAFPFENFLGKLKRLLRSANHPLAQVCRRLNEKRKLTAEKIVTMPPIFEIISTNGPNNVTKFKYKEFTFSNTSPNNMILLDDGNIASIQKVYKENDTWKMKCQFWKKKKSLYLYPFDSSKLNIWKLHSQPSRKVRTRLLTVISNKLIKLQVAFSADSSEKIYVLPFLH